MDATFEQRIRRIFALVCPAARKDAQASSITGELIGPLESVRRRNQRFAKAQAVLLEELSSIDRTKRSLESERREARRNRDKSLVAELSSQLKIANIKDAILRKLSDCMAWQLIDGRSDIAKQLDVSEPSRPDLNSSNVESVKEAAEQLNSSNPLSFSLISDLTSFVQIGDLVYRDLHLLKLIEVKEGDKNIQAIQILEEQPDLVRNIESLTGTYGENLAGQVRRIYHQKIRADRAIQIIGTGMGPDPVSGITVTINEPSIPPLGYDHELAELLLRLDQETWAYTALEGALLIGCYRDYMKPVGHEILKAIADQLFKRNFFVIDFGQGLRTGLTEPIFLKPFREKDIMDIVFARTRVIIAISLDAIMKMFEDFGLEARWLSRKETVKQQSQSKSHVLLTYNGRAICISNADLTLTLGDAFLTRIVFDSLLPSSVVSMFSEAFSSSNC
jgi:hypothetical protein